jgi:outer membrane protein OmpA-like peptidoglycan-associated protein/tetratricopeptide (TPR) repeat protein
MYRILFAITASLLLNATILLGQDARREQADILFRSEAYAAAIDTYLRIENSGAGDMETKIRLALCYHYNRDFIKALEWLEKAAQINRLADNYTALYADLLRNTGENVKADSIYLQLADRQKSYQRRAQLWSQNTVIKIPPSTYKVESIPGFNTVDDEMCPTYYRDGLVFISSTNKKKKNYEWNGRGWLAVQYAPYKPKGGEKAKPSEFKGPVNDFMHSGPVAFAQNDNLMFFTKSLLSRAKSEQGVARLGIFYAAKRAGNWQASKAFRYNNFKKFSVAHPTVSADGKEMFFVSDMPGGQGGTDIYYTKYSNGTWTTPVNLGPLINTPYNEMFPFYHKDKTLYFASEGHPGFGGLDIFYSKFEDGIWSIPVNMGLPVNSGFDDFSILLDKDKINGYFSSNRPGGAGNDDIYRLVYVDPEAAKCRFTLGGMVSDKLTLASIFGAEVSFADEAGETVSSRSDEGGFYTLRVPCAMSAITIRATAAGYFPFEKTISRTDDAQKMMLNIYLDKVELNKSIIVPNICYDLDKSDIKPEAAKELDKLVSLLNRNTSWIVEIGSHTDSRADNSYNLRLSDRRAKAAVDYIVSKGISAERLFAKGYGETKLVNECGDGTKCPEEKHAVNRRTEFRLIGYEKFAYEEEGQKQEAERVIFAPEYQGNAKEIVYKIQIGVFSNPDLNLLQKFTDLGNLLVVPVEGTAQSRYLIEKYDSYNTALGYLKKVQARGIKDAFIVPYRNGVAITMQEAKDLEGR